MTRVLVVDDDEDFTRIAQKHFEGVGWQVETSQTPIGLSARLLLEPEVDVLVIDCMMPALSGPIVVGLLARHPRLRRLPVVLVSAAPQATVAPSLADSGLEALCFVQKTGRVGAVVAAAQTLVSRRPSSSTTTLAAAQGTVDKEREVYPA